MRTAGHDARRDLGALVRRHRTALALTQEELAHKAGSISVDTVAAVERGRSRPYRATMEMLCTALDLGPDDRAAMVQVWRSARARPGAPVATGAREETPARIVAPPVRLTSLVGRDGAVARLTSLVVRDDVRLLTVVGPGGVGKTSVVLQAAATPALTVAFPDGTAWVDLAPVRIREGVLPAVAAALGVEAGTDEPIGEQLATHLSGRRVLLVLDNAEHLVDAAPLLAELLAAASSVTALVTSRAALRVRGERLLPLAPLELAPSATRSDPTALGRSTAVQLFCERAAAVDPTLDLAGDLATVDAICRRLDALPLAIELAAARLSLFSPAALLERLTQSFEVLASGPRDLPARQLTLRSTLAWSVDLLSPGERTLLSRMSVFVGGSTVEAITVACAGPVGDPVGLDVVPDLLVGLDAQSLLVRDEGGRVRLLETVREFARARLDDDALVRARDRHAGCQLDLAEQAAGSLGSAGRVPWLDRLDADRDNLREALTWTAGDPVRAARLASALGWWWYFRGSLAEGRTWLDAALATLPADADPELAARTAWHAGRLAHLQGAEREALVLLERSVALWRTCPDGTLGLAYALADLGQVVWYRGRWNDGVRIATEAVATFRRTDDRWGLALALQDLGQACVSSGDLPAARGHYSENLAIYTDLDDRWGRGLALLGLGRVAFASSALDRARDLLQRSQDAFAGLPDRRLEAHALMRLGQVERRLGDTSVALTCYRSAFTAWSELGSRVGTGLATAGLAGVAARDGYAVRAARLAGAAAAQLEAQSRAMTPSDQADYAPYLTVARAALGGRRYGELVAQGRALSRDEVTSLVLDDAD